jgi:tetratricopeptide (TPR) repeat protein
LLDGRPTDALAAFQKSLALAGHDYPYEAVGVLLLTSDAQRRAEDQAAAERVWQDAARLAAELLAPPTQVIDPILWERIAYLRPVRCAWPGETCHALSDANTAFGIVADPPTASASISSTDEVPLWTAIGHWRLSRNEAQAALVALKRAESLSSQPYVAGRLQLSQAKALVKLGQSSAATAILIHLASGSDPLVGHAATAMLGTSRLQQGGVQEGFNLLRQAVETDATAVWPERTQAEADLGLAYLLMGDEPSGIRRLHEAQHGFEAAGENEALLQCLENEAAYLEHTKKTDLAKAIRQHIEALRGA